MNLNQEREVNQATYRRLRDTINQKYPRGRFLAISGGNIIADGASLLELQAALKARRMNPAHVLLVEAGVDYSENAIIFSDFPT